MQTALLNKRLPEQARSDDTSSCSPLAKALALAAMALAGPVGEEGAWVGALARNVGVAFQILNDLGDWRGDDHNKLSAAGDVLGGRPTVLWALALEGLTGASRAEKNSVT